MRWWTDSPVDETTASSETALVKKP